MKQQSQQKLTGYGLATDLIDRIVACGLTLTEVTGSSQRKWRSRGFTADEAKLIYDQVTRKPIADEVVAAVVAKSGGCCCYCADGIAARPYQLHHMEEHHVSRNDSEANLLLVCPTHHVYIHASGLSEVEQRAAKMAWEQLMELAQAYEARGLLFPYGDFAPQLYPAQYDITELFRLGTPSGAVCRAVTTGQPASEALRQLQQHRRLLLSGESGSGKSTFATGIAGHVAAQGTRVFTYLGGGRDGQAIVQAVAKLALVARSPVLLLLDDANRLLNPAQIEQVLLTANAMVTILVVVTREQYASEGNVEQHFLREAYYLDWSVLQPAVKAALLAHEESIAAYIRQHAAPASRQHLVGSGTLDIPLERLIDQYAQDARTAWQFMYLLGGGIQQLEQARREQRGRDRFDIVVLQVALTQLTEFEKTTAVSDLVAFYALDPVLSRTSPPDPEWLREQLTQLTRTRLLVTERGRFKTVHREFARAFLEATYQDAGTRPDAVRLLNYVFNEPVAHIRQVVILWSWLENSELSSYLAGWYQQTALATWREMVLAAAAHSLETVAMLAYSLQMRNLDPRRTLIAEAFRDAAPALEVAARRSKPEEGTFFLLRKLSTVLERYCPAVFIALLDGLGAQYFIDRIAHVACDEVDDLSQILLAAEEKHPAWVLAFPGSIGVETVRQIARRATLGDVESMFKLAGFQRRFLFELTRSQLDFYVARLAELLTGCPLRSLRYAPLDERTLPELSLSPPRVQQLLAGLDMVELAREYETAAPRYWGELLSFSLLEERVGLNALGRFVDALRPAALVKNVVKYPADTHALRLMLYQLCYGSPTQRVDSATQLRPHVEAVLRQTQGEYDNDVLLAFTRLDPAQGAQVQALLNLPTPVQHARITPADLAADLAMLAYWDATEVDYALPAYLVGSGTLPTNETIESGEATTPIPTA